MVMVFRFAIGCTLKIIVDLLTRVWKSGVIGEKYNIGGECEVTNINLVKKILQMMKKDESMIEYVTDRPGHDRRYSTSIKKIKEELL